MNSVNEVKDCLAEQQYIATTEIATVLFLAEKLGKPVLAEGPAGINDLPSRGCRGETPHDGRRSLCERQRALQLLVSLDARGQPGSQSDADRIEGVPGSGNTAWHSRGQAKRAVRWALSPKAAFLPIS